MPRSPRDFHDAEDELRYGRAWLALNTMLRQGKSFSGRERNRCFLNVGSGTFADVSSASGLGFSDDARAVAAVDWDFDGDLDLWTRNSTSPRVRFLSNDHPHHNHFIALRLQGAESQGTQSLGVTSNRDAIGARVELYLGPNGRNRRIKSLRAGEGFLSQSTKWMHFGMGNFQHIDRVVVCWPGGDAETFRGLQADRFWQIIQGTGRAIPFREHPGGLGGSPPKDTRRDSQRLGGRAPQPPRFKSDETNTPTSASQPGRLVLLNPVPLPAFQYHPLERPDDSVSLLRGRPLLLGLWATWCAPCIDELSLWTAHHDRLTRAGLSVTVLCVDESLEGPQLNSAKVRRVTEPMRMSFDVGFPQSNLVQFLDIAQRTFTFAQRPLSLPCSFLIDAQGRLAVVYKGPVSIDQLIEDGRHLAADDDTVLARAIPFAGRWLEQLEPLPLRKLVLALHEAGHTDAAKAYIAQLVAAHADRGDEELAQLYRIQGAMFLDEKAADEAIAAFQNVLRFTPYDHRAHVELANLAILKNDLTLGAGHLSAALRSQPKDPSLLKTLAALKLRQRRTQEAIGLFRKSLALRNDAEVHFALANALIATHQPREAIVHLEQSLTLRPGWPPAANNLAWIVATHSDSTIRDGHKAVELAELACRATNNAVPEFLTTLAAALAELGRFDRAVAVVQSAIDIAQKNDNVALLARARRELEHYRDHRPLRPTNESP